MGRGVTQEDIMGAVARAWCYPENEEKVMDEKLAIAASIEICKLLGIEWNDH